MEFRDATPADADTVRAIARESLASSYAPALDDDTIEEAVGGWYAPENVAEALEDDETVLLLGVEGGEAVGFVKGVVVGRREPAGEIHWLHVAPAHRGRGVGSRLLEAIERRLDDTGAERFTGFTLAVNEEGVGFYERHGYEHAGTRTLTIGGESFKEAEFDRRVGADGEGTLHSVDADGATRYVAYGEAERGSTAPFYPLYSDSEGATRYGYLCGDCESADVAVDAMEGYACNGCGNRHKPSRWDAAYL